MLITPSRAALVSTSFLSCDCPGAECSVAASEPQCVFKQLIATHDTVLQPSIDGTRVFIYIGDFYPRLIMSLF